jgi:hypothetical protein
MRRWPNLREYGDARWIISKLTRRKMQRIDCCVGIIGPYEIQRVDRAVLNKITDSLERAKVLSGAGAHRPSRAVSRPASAFYERREDLGMRVADRRGDLQSRGIERRRVEALSL